MTTMDMEMEVSGVTRAVATEIREVYDASAGEDFARGVLARARNESSALHSHFEWDDSAAAEGYRLQQAEQLIRRVRVVVLREDDKPAIRVRAYVSGKRLSEAGMDLGADAGLRRYLAIESVAGQSDSEATLLAAIQHDLNMLRSKYRHVSDFSALLQGLLAEE